MRCLSLKQLFPEFSSTEMWVMVFLFHITSLMLTLEEFEELVSSQCYDLRRVTWFLVSWHFEILGTQQLSSSLKKGARKVSFTDCRLDKL